MKLRSRRPSPAMVVALIALVVAMGGTSWAVVKNSVGTPQLKDHAVTAPKLHKNAVTSAAVKDGALQPRDLSANALLGPGLVGRGSLVDFRLAPGSPVTTTQTLAFTVPAGRRLLLADVVFQNPGADQGRLRVQRNGAILIEVGLNTFRTLQEHFETPLVFQQGQKVELFIDCDNPSGGCTPGALFSGALAG